MIKSQFKEQVWKTLASPERVLTLFEKKEPYNPSIDKTYSPFRMLWGDLHRVHTLVCQGGRYEKVGFSEEGSSIHLIFDLPNNSSFEQRGQKREIEFFIDLHPGILFVLNGQSSNTFEIGQKITLSMGDQEVSLIFNLLEGEGHFLGHITRSNRPSQIENKGENSFQVYDWAIFLRTIRRNNPCRILATLTFQ